MSLLGSLILGSEYVRLRKTDGVALLEVMPLYINLQPVQLTDTGVTNAQLTLWIKRVLQ